MSANLQILNDLKAGFTNNNWQDIDAGTAGMQGRHIGIAKVVVGLNGDADPYLPGIELCKRIEALPDLIAALRYIANDDEASVYDLRHAAKVALEVAGV